MALVHRYLYGIYSSRKLEDACQHHIDFRWPLEDLYYGNITPYDRQIRSGTSLMKAMDQSQECEEKLTELLEDDAHNPLLRLINAENEISSTLALENFILGFRLGARLILEMLDEDDGSLMELLRRDEENGDPIFRYIYADTQKELTVKLRQNIIAYQGVDLTEECRMTLSEWLDRWLEQTASVLQLSTLEHYYSDMEHHVKPYLGQKKLTQITLSDLRKLYDTLKQCGRVHPRPGQSRGLSTTTVHGIHTTLHHALKSAVGQRPAAG